MRDLAIQLCFLDTQDSFEIFAEVGELITILGQAGPDRYRCVNSAGQEFVAWSSWVRPKGTLEGYAAQRKKEFHIADEIAFRVVCETDLTLSWERSRIDEALRMCVDLGVVTHRDGEYSLSPLGRILRDSELSEG